MRCFRSVPVPSTKLVGTGINCVHTPGSVRSPPSPPPFSLLDTGRRRHPPGGGRLAFSARGAAPVAAFPTRTLGRRPGRGLDANSCLAGPTWSSQPCPLRGLWARTERKIGPLTGPSGEQSRASASPTASRDHMETRLHMPRSLLSQGKQTAVHGRSRWPGAPSRPAELRKFRAARGRAQDWRLSPLPAPSPGISVGPLLHAGMMGSLVLNVTL